MVSGEGHTSISVRNTFPLSILSRYADQISVKMADGPKYSLQLFEEGCKRITAINVQYKGENETEWQATKTLAKH